MKFTNKVLREKIKEVCFMLGSDQRCYIPRDEVLALLDEQDKELEDLYLLLRDAYNQLERGKDVDMVKLGCSIRVAFKRIKEVLG